MAAGAEDEIAAGQRKQHVVADIDGTVLKSYNVEDDAEDLRLFQRAVRQLGRTPDINEPRLRAFIRPGAIKLMRLWFQRYGSVSLFTAASHDYALRIADYFERRCGGKFLHVWWREKCDLVTPDPDEPGDTGIRKRLRYMWASPESRAVGMAAHNTIMIEDSPMNGADNPYNIITVVEYDDEAVRLDDPSGAMRLVWKMMKELATATDVRRRLSRMAMEREVADAGERMKSMAVSSESTSS